jgi:hypothetical protein
MEKLMTLGTNKEEVYMSGKTKSEKTFWERFNESLENQKRLIASTEYFDWLYEFTKKHRQFSDIDWLYDRVSISEDDYSQLELLTDFFTAVDRYHRDNLLETNAQGYAAWYNIKYKDVYFAIGIRVGQGASNFVTRYKNFKEMAGEPFIEFEYILKNKEAPGLVQKKATLQSLQDTANLLRDLGVPKSAVDDVIQKAFEKKA